jgi:4'-phosphopantetheinyl transferase EntD
MSDKADVRPSTLFASLFRQPVAAFELRGVLAAEHTLLQEELACVVRAAPKRRGEFAAGRACAHAALAQLSVADVPLLVGADREPLWPAGITGSITHTSGFCAAVLASKGHIESLGIDAEIRTAVRRELWRQVITSDERAWLESLPEGQAGEMASVLFGAKEAFFKCQYPLTRQWLGFGDVSVSIDGATFSIQPRKTAQLAHRFAAPWTGRFAIAEEFVLTAIALGAAPTAP